MNIFVTVKQVADPNIPPSHIQLDASARRIVSPFGIAPVMNGYDANALEEALRLREKHGGKVIAVSLGEESSRDTLKRAVAMGANAAVLLADPEWLHADAASLGKIIATGIRKSGPFDLVLCGRQASDTDGGQVLHWIALYLGIPVVTPVTRIETVDNSNEDGTLTVHRLTEEGTQRVRVKLPAMLGVSSEMNEPRLPPMRGLMNAGRAMIPAWKKADLGVELAPARVELRKLSIQLREGNAEMIPGKSGAEMGVALADKLREKGVI